MNFASVKEININGKNVKEMSMNGKLVFSVNDNLVLTRNPSYVRNGDSLTINALLKSLEANIEIKFYKVVNMTRTLLTNGTKTTNSSGVATYTYNGVGAGEFEVVAVSGDYESNKIKIDDYVPVASRINLVADKINIASGTSIDLTATVLDQYGQTMNNASVVFKAGETTLDTITSGSNGVATLSNYTPSENVTVTASVGTEVSNALNLNVYTPAATSITVAADNVYLGETVHLVATVKDQFGYVMSGQTVSFLKGETSLGTDDTDSSGVATYDYSTSSLTSAETATFNAVLGSLTASVSVEITTIATQLTINTPFSLVYSDFGVTGTLKNGRGEVISGKTVILYTNDGSLTQIGSATTDSSGIATFTKPPVGTGSHKFIMKYTGSGAYESSESSEVTYVITKETSVITVNNPTNNLEANYGTSVSVSGVLEDNDGEILASKYVLVKEGTATLATLQTDSNGAFSGTLSGLTDTTHNLVITYAGDDNYTETSANRTVKVKPTITLTEANNKTILSKADNETATLQATLNSSSLSGHYIDFISDPLALQSFTDTGSAASSITVSGRNITFWSYDGQNDSPIVYNSLIKDNDVLYHFEVKNLRFGRDGTAYIQLYDSSNNTISQGYVSLSNGVYDIYCYHDGNSFAVFKNGEFVQNLNVGTALANGGVKLGFLLDYGDFGVYDFNEYPLVGTGTTNSSGVATCTYYSKGVGDINFKAKYGMIVSETYSIEDCKYYNTTEVSRTTTQGSTIYDDNLSQALNTNHEITFDIYSNNSASGEHRFFLLPKTQFNTGTTQPSYAVYVDLLGSNKANIGKRENGSTTGIVTGFSCTSSTYHTVKIVKTATSVAVYIDDTLKTTQTLSWIGNYTDYTLSMMRWSASGTSKVKNVKFKQL